MLSGRRWSAAEFDRYIVRHPVVGLLARRLLWSAAAAGQVFRVTEDRTLADRDESPVAARAGRPRSASSTRCTSTRRPATPGRRR